MQRVIQILAFSFLFISPCICRSAEQAPGKEYVVEDLGAAKLAGDGIVFYSYETTVSQHQFNQRLDFYSLGNGSTRRITTAEYEPNGFYVSGSKIVFGERMAENSHQSQTFLTDINGAAPVKLDLKGPGNAQSSVGFDGDIVLFVDKSIVPGFSSPFGLYKYQISSGISSVVYDPRDSSLRTGPRIEGFDISGSTIAWTELTGEKEDEFEMHIVASARSGILKRKGTQMYPAVSGLWVFFHEMIDNDIYTYNTLYNVMSEEERSIGKAMPHKYSPSYNGVDISGDYAVWLDTRPINSNYPSVYLYDIKNKQEWVIASRETRKDTVSIVDNRVLWKEYNSTVKKYEYHVYQFDLSSFVAPSPTLTPGVTISALLDALKKAKQKLGIAKKDLRPLGAAASKTAKAKIKKQNKKIADARAEIKSLLKGVLETLEAGFEVGSSYSNLTSSMLKKSMKLAKKAAARTTPKKQAAKLWKELGALLNKISRAA